MPFWLFLGLAGSRRSLWQIRDPLCRAPRRVLLDEVTDTTLPGKATKLQLHTTVPQTDTGARDEYSKALERTREKELGKLTP